MTTIRNVFNKKYSVFLNVSYLVPSHYVPCFQNEIKSVVIPLRCFDADKNVIQFRLPAGLWRFCRGITVIRLFTFAPRLYTCNAPFSSAQVWHLVQIHSCATCKWFGCFDATRRRTYVAVVDNDVSHHLRLGHGRTAIITLKFNKCREIKFYCKEADHP